MRRKKIPSKNFYRMPNMKCNDNEMMEFSIILLFLIWLADKEISSCRENRRKYLPAGKNSGNIRLPDRKMDELGK